MVWAVWNRLICGEIGINGPAIDQKKDCKFAALFIEPKYG